MGWSVYSGGPGQFTPEKGGQFDRFFHPMGRDSGKKDDGFDPTCGIVDEWHAHENDEAANIIESGMGSRVQPLMDYITTAGKNKQGPCYRMRNVAVNILKGLMEDDKFLCQIFSLDSEQEWENPEAWCKPNPNLGVSVSLGFLKDRFTKAQNEAGTKQIDFKTKNLNLWTDTASIWILSEMLALCNKGPITIDGRLAFGGIQLAATRGINCFCLCLPRDDGGEDYKFWFWLPKDMAYEDSAMKDSYIKWASDGWLTLTPGNVIDYALIMSRIKEVREKSNLQTIHVAPQYESALMPLAEDNFIEKCSNSYANMTNPLQKFQTRVNQQAINHGGNPVLAWMMGNVALSYGPDTSEEDDEYNAVRIDKEDSMGPVPGPVAMLMAYRGFLEHKPVPSPGVY